MKLIAIIFRKELKDMLRDRRTIMAMIILPLLLVPTIFTIMARTSFSSDQDSLKDIRVAIVSNDNGDALIQRFQRRKDLKIFEDISPYDFKSLILEDSIDFGLIIDKQFDAQIEKGNTGKLEIFYAASGRRDTLLYGNFVRTIRDYRRSVVNDRLDSLGTSVAILNPTTIDKNNVQPPKDTIGSFVGGVLSLFFIMFCFLGSMYPAIDLFTGEKERGTIETLLVLPASRLQILLGKLLVIVLAGVISGVITFFGVYIFLKLNADLPFISLFLNFKTALWIILMSIPLAIFFAGILIPISIYTKSFKEAQSLIQPLVIFIVVPVFFAMFPSIELNYKTALIPIMNIALTCKAMISGSIESGHLVVVYLSLFMFAALGIVLARQQFGDEGNLFRN